MKKLLIAAGLVAVTTLSASAAPFSGPAVGLALGVSNMSNKNSQTPFGGNPFGNVGKASATGFNGRVFGQWSTIRGSFHFGVDLGVGVDTAKTKKTISGSLNSLGFTQAQLNTLIGTYKLWGTALTQSVTVTQTVRNNFFAAPGVRFGGVVGGKTLVYGRLGVNVQFQKIETSIVCGGTTALLKNNAINTQVAPGVGVDYMINDNMFVRGQVEYGIGVGQTGKNKFKKKPSSFVANVGVGYQF